MARVVEPWVFWRLSDGGLLVGEALLVGLGTLVVLAG